MVSTAWRPQRRAAVTAWQRRPPCQPAQSGQTPLPQTRQPAQKCAGDGECCCSCRRRAVLDGSRLGRVGCIGTAQCVPGAPAEHSRPLSRQPISLTLSGLQSNAATGWQERSLSHSSSALPTTPSFSPVRLSSITLKGAGRMKFTGWVENGQARHPEPAAAVMAHRSAPHHSVVSIP